MRQRTSVMATRNARPTRLSPGWVTVASGAVVLVSSALPWVTVSTGWDYYDASRSTAKLLFDRPEGDGIGLFFTGLVAALCGVLTILLGAALLRRELHPTAPTRSSASVLYGGSAVVAAAFPTVNVFSLLTVDVGDVAGRFGLIEYGLWLWLLAALVAMAAVIASAKGRSPSQPRT